MVGRMNKEGPGWYKCTEATAYNPFALRRFRTTDFPHLYRDSNNEANYKKKTAKRAADCTNCASSRRDLAPDGVQIHKALKGGGTVQKPLHFKAHACGTCNHFS